MANKVLTDNLSELLNSATTTKFDVKSCVGHLTIDKITSGDQVLETGSSNTLRSREYGPGP